MDDIKQLFFGNMSERAAKIMEEDMEALGTVQKKKCQKPVQALWTLLSPSLSQENLFFLVVVKMTNSCTKLFNSFDLTVSNEQIVDYKAIRSKDRKEVT